MKDKVKIFVPIGCRSDAGLSAPIIKRLKEADWCILDTISLFPGEYVTTLNLMEDYFISRDVDLVLCVGDRTEMVAAARAAYDNHIKIGHVYAGAMGDTSEKATLDDINRFVISLYADICFCEDFECAHNIAKLWALLNKFDYKFGELTEFWRHNIYIVGITHMDDLEVDESLVPPDPYDLVLINAEITTSGLDLFKQAQEITNQFYRKSIWIPSNSDQYNNGIGKINFDYNEDLPRPQYFGLLKNCRRFITNSSSGYYEAPFFLKEEQIVWVGKRNANRREYKRLETGASDKIVKILEEYFKK